MFPVIYDFGPINIFGFQFDLVIYSFGLMLVLAFYSCYFFLNYDFYTILRNGKILLKREKLPDDLFECFECLECDE